MLKSFRHIVHEHLPWILIPWRVFYRGKQLWCRFLCRGHMVKALNAVSASICRIRMSTNPIRVGFYVYNDAVFQYERLFVLMEKDADFDPYIVVVSGMKIQSTALEADRIKTHQRVVASLCERYPGRVLDSWDDAAGKNHDFSGRFDICACMNPYDGYQEKCCRISHLAQRGIPVFYSHYGFEGGDVADRGVFGMSSFGFVWRYYTGNPGLADLINMVHPHMKGRNAVRVLGNPKYEKLGYQSIVARRRKRVIVAPHHTIAPGESFHISNFLTFSQFLLSLPKKYPQIDWIFRPHPLLLPKMVDAGFWSDKDCEEYVCKWKSYPNSTYQDGGDYAFDFVNSDAMIQDCSSFLAEYHVTGHPQCYMIKSEEHIKTQYFGMGYDLLNLTYKASSESDILKFIDDVVLGEKDCMRDKRMAFLRNTLLLNFPHVSEMILQDLKREFNR